MSTTLLETLFRSQNTFQRSLFTVLLVLTSMFGNAGVTGTAGAVGTEKPKAPPRTNLRISLPTNDVVAKLSAMVASLSPDSYRKKELLDWQKKVEELTERLAIAEKDKDEALVQNNTLWIANEKWKADDEIRIESEKAIQKFVGEITGSNNLLISQVEGLTGSNEELMGQNGYYKSELERLAGSIATLTKEVKEARGKDEDDKAAASMFVALQIGYDARGKDIESILKENKRLTKERDARQEKQSQDKKKQEEGDLQFAVNLHNESSQQRKGATSSSQRPEQTHAACSGGMHVNHGQVIIQRGSGSQPPLSYHDRGEPQSPETFLDQRTGEYYRECRDENNRVWRQDIPPQPRQRGLLPKHPPPTSFFYGGDVEVDGSKKS